MRRAHPFLAPLLLLLLAPSLHAQVFEDVTSSFFVSLPPGSTSGIDMQLSHPTGYTTATPGSFNFTLSHNAGDVQDDITISLPDGLTLTTLNDPIPCDPSLNALYTGAYTLWNTSSVSECNYTVVWDVGVVGSMYVHYQGQALLPRRTMALRSSLLLFIPFTNPSSSPTHFDSPVLFDTTSAISYPAPVSGSTVVVGAFNTAYSGTFTFVLTWSGDYTDTFDLSFDGAVNSQITLAPGDAEVCERQGTDRHIQFTLGYFTNHTSCGFEVAYTAGDSGSFTITVQGRPSSTAAFTGYLVYMLNGNEGSLPPNKFTPI